MGFIETILEKYYNPKKQKVIMQISKIKSN